MSIGPSDLQSAISAVPPRALVGGVRRIEPKRKRDSDEERGETDRRPSGGETIDEIVDAAAALPEHTIDLSA